MTDKNLTYEHHINIPKLTRLVLKVQQGNKNSLERIITETQEYIYYYSLSLLKSDDMAYEAVQDISLIIIQNINGIKNAESFLGWLKVVIINYCKSKQKKENDNVSLDEAYETVIDNAYNNPEKSVEIEDIHKTLNSIIEILPEFQKKCIYMYYYEKMDIKQIAAALNIKQGTVKSRLFNARKAIKSELEKYDKENITLDGFSLYYIYSSLLNNCKDSGTKVKMPYARNASFFKGAVTSIAELSVAVKVTAIASACIVTAGGITAYNVFQGNGDNISNNVNNTVPSVQITETQPVTAATEKEPIPDMKKELFYANGFTDEDLRKEIIFNPDEDLISENNKSYVYDRMRNSVEYFDTIQGTFYYSDQSSTYYMTYCGDMINQKSKEITYSVDGIPISYEVFNNGLHFSACFDNDATIVKESDDSENEEIANSIMNDRKNKYAKELSEKTWFYRTDRTYEEELDFVALVDSRKRRKYSEEEGDYISYGRDNPTGLHLSGEQFFPELFTVNHMGDFSMWNIDRTDSILDRECFVITGTSNGFNDINEYELYVDKELGSILSSKTYNAYGEQIGKTVVYEFVVDSEINNSIFDDDLMEIKYPYE